MKNKLSFKAVVIISLIFISIIVVALDDSTPPQQQSTNTITEVENTQLKNKNTNTSIQEITPAFKLASLEYGNNNPPQNMVSEFDDILAKLSIKCPNEKIDEISGYIFIGKDIIEKKSVSITLLEVANGINESIPEEAIGIVTCKEIAAIFATLISSN
jgi:hypothetical protein